MNQKLNDFLTNLTKDEFTELTEPQKKAIKILKDSKKSINFSSVTENDCTKIDGLNLNVDNLLFINASSLHIPSDFPKPIPSDSLCKTIKNIIKVWVLNNEKANRMVIDAILTEALLSESNDKLVGYCEVKNDWEGKGIVYTGNVDYMIGSSKSKSDISMDSYLLVVEAKKEWVEKSVYQAISEAGCLLKRRLEAGKNTPVFAVLTTGFIYRFFAIDIEGVVYCSGIVVLNDDNDNYSKCLSDILHWITWFMTAIKSISPRSPNKDLTETVEDSLKKLTACFGLKNSNNKFKPKN